MSPAFFILLTALDLPKPFSILWDPPHAAQEAPLNTYLREALGLQDAAQQPTAS